MADVKRLDDDTTRALRRLVAAIAYRSSRVVKDVPDAYPELELGSGVRPPREILQHMTAVLGYVKAKVTGTERERYTALDWAGEVERFYSVLTAIDAALAVGADMEVGEADRMLQGPLADVLTHIGQLAMMRRVADAPVPGENYIKASIEIGRVGIEQGEPTAPSG